ncbi:MAG: hypothetical protein ACYTF3_13620 [Planctomycetota bacterium]
MISPFVMLLLLVCFSASLGLLLSVYREEEPQAILRGTLRRGLNFMVAVMLLAGVAYWVSGSVLLPSA